MPASKISLQNAKEEKLFYVVANVVVYRETDGRCLILQRSKEEKVHPGKYGVVGGKLEWRDLDINNPTRVHGDVLDYEDAMENLLAREVREEASIEIEGDLIYVNSVGFIRPDEVPSILVKFGAKYKRGDVKIDASEFISHAWVNGEEVKKYDCMMGIADEVAGTIEKFQRR